jgi:hypothetical protein
VKPIDFETVEILDQTKTSFKSRQLADIRRKLEDLIREVPGQAA